MSRRFRPRVVQVPPGATTVRIPRQRGGASSPVVVVVSDDRPSLTARAVRAVGGWAWRHRAAWAPTAYALLAYGLTALVHVIAPWMAWVLAPATLIPAAALLWAARKQPEAFGDRPARLATLAALATLAVGWAAATVHYGPRNAALAWLWVGLAVSLQGFWLVVRRSK